MKSSLMAATVTTALAVNLPNVKEIHSQHFRSQRNELLKNHPSVSDSAQLQTSYRELEKQDIALEGLAPMKHFEVLFGNDCTNAAYVHGWRNYVCVDEVEDDGSLYSYKFVARSDGPPQARYFVGHQCRSDWYIGTFDTFDLSEMGFPPNYVLGTCHDFVDTMGTVIYRGKVGYSHQRHEPDYPHAASADASKARGCDPNRERFVEYDFERSDFCFDDEDEAGNVEFYKWDLTNCTIGNIDRVYYSDSACATATPLRRVTYYGQNCSFDSGRFFNDMNSMGSATLVYDFKQCSLGPP